MQKTTKIRESLIENFSGKISQDLYAYVVNYGFRDKEEETCKKYFKKNDKILDLGCGSGRLTVALYENGYKNITGVDLTPKMIELAKQGTKDKKIEFLVGDATALQFADETFDAVVFTHNGWSQIPEEKNRLKALQEVRRVLKPNGVFIISAVIFRWNWFMLLKWCKFHLAKLFKIKIWEIEFGDVILYTYEDYRKDWCRWIPKLGKHQDILKLFIHYYPSAKSFEAIAKKAGFSTVEIVPEFQSKKSGQYRLVLRKN